MARNRARTAQVRPAPFMPSVEATAELGENSEVEEVEVEDDEAQDTARELGSVVTERAVPFEVRPDGSIAHFAHASAQIAREVGS